MFEFDEVEGAIQALREMAMAVPWWFWAIPVSLLIVWVTSKPVKHAWRIRKASWVLRVLSEIGLSKGPGAQFGFLRSRAVDPYTFEEAILTALLERGVKIRRNSRYTGDGGIDGQAWINGRRVLIQAKLYKGHINPAHVEDFVILCKKNKSLGLFVHSGKTGPASRRNSSESIDIVSGDRLLKLLSKDRMQLLPKSLKFDL